ncbi:conserved hypothetical protein [Planktothrix sp. PCC 11201]|uniref:hypothetical protein n=1 Tax=Planktothrix sp. PCC 11201 TaxID=1729650 RepID=UPI000910AD20|nr:hypothetical protein [Planktothrix sp. PCC 11201]SKB14787.1 conserved hypothetical protein [Planktothrix sp. PCC 11201]
MNSDSLEQAKNREQVFDNFQKIEYEIGANLDKFAFLDQGLEKSPYQNHIQNYSQYLNRKPLQYSPYPALGKIPYIDQESLAFLHPQIEEACISLGKFEAGELHTIWLGRNPLKTTQFWSTTKIIPVLNTLIQIDQKFPKYDVNNLKLQNSDNRTANFCLKTAIEDIVNYKHKVASSNALAALFKRFETRSNLEKWLQKITGNSTSNFQGDYGENPVFLNPEIVDPDTKTTILKAVLDTTKGDNFVSAYDLTRLISLIGWHNYLPAQSQLPNLPERNFNCLVKALGQDPARYVDVALKTLGIEQLITSPVILSKMGYGDSTVRQTVELCYVAFVQFIDPLPNANQKPSEFRTLALTLRGVIPINNKEDFTQQALELDARMAAEVTEIFRRVVVESLDKL